jgi:release factor glutamine methyltransferase
MFTVSGQDFWLWYIKAQQDAISVDIPVYELDWLLQQISDLDRLTLKLNSGQFQSEVILKMPFFELKEKWQKRINEQLPVQYIAGFTPWRNFTLKVSPAVLIPRPETELIIDIALSLVSDLTVTNLADLGTGSGAIACGLAEVFPHTIIHAVDFSKEAVNIANENVKSLGFSDRVFCYHGSWWQPITHLQGQICGMISNPPYIPRGIIPDLQPEVVKHEPHLALDGGDDGLDAIRYLVNSAPDYVLSGGFWLVELMAGQAESVVNLLQSHGGYQQIAIHEDLAGMERFVSAKFV